METISSHVVADCTAAEVAAAFMRSFEQYFVPMNVSARSYERRFRGEHLDPFASRIYFSGESVAGLLLVARRGWTSRVAAVGVVPELRGRGLGRRFMEEALDDARGRGDHAIILEVIEENVTAIALYTRFGFRVMRRLIGYKHAGVAAVNETTDALDEIDPLAFSRFVSREGDADLPWMLAAETFAAAAAPSKAYRLGEHACALVANAGTEPLALAGVVVSRDARRKGWGSRMLHALQTTYAGRAWVVQPVVPEGLHGDFFARAGWERQSLTQLEMRMELV